MLYTVRQSISLSILYCMGLYISYVTLKGEGGVEGGDNLNVSMG